MKVWVGYDSASWWLEIEEINHFDFNVPLILAVVAALSVLRQM